MYQKVMPALMKIERDHNLTPTLSIPLCFYGDEEEGVLVMENLKTLGYYMTDMKEGERRHLITVSSSSFTFDCSRVGQGQAQDGP